MKGSLIFCTIVAVALLDFFAATAHCQVISPSGALNRSMAGPVVEKYIRDAYAPVDYYRNNGGGNFAYPINQDQGYANGYGPGYYGGSYGPSGRAGRAVTGGIIGGGVGAAIGGLVGGRRGALYGAGAGAAVGVATTLLASNRGYAVGGPAAGGMQSEFMIGNNTPFSLELYSVNSKGKEKRIVRMGAGETIPVKPPKPGESYVGYELIPNERGGLSSFRVLPKPTTNGWTFEPPARLR
jgi:hypothetical protein